MTDSIKHVGLDVHSATIEVVIADGGSGQAGEVRRYGQIANRPAAVAKMIKELSADGQVLCFWYEAGPTGYGLYRQLIAAGHDCHVVAPSLVPRKAGDRVKTDRRDAVMLARLGRAGELTSVWVPGPEQEAMRDLTRCRGDAKSMQRVARQQLGSFLLRHERHYDQGKDKWTKTYFRWLSDQKFESPVQQIVFQEYIDAVTQTSDRVDQLTKQLERCAKSWSLWPMVQGLCALRGVDLVTPGGGGDHHVGAWRHHAFRLAAPVDGVPGPGAQRAFIGQEPSSGRDHQDGQHARAAGAGGVELVLPAPRANDQAYARQGQARDAGGAGDRVESAEAPVRPLPTLDSSGEAERADECGSGAGTVRLHLGDRAGDQSARGRGCRAFAAAREAGGTIRQTDRSGHGQPVCRILDYPMRCWRRE